MKQWRRKMFLRRGAKVKEYRSNDRTTFGRSKYLYDMLLDKNVKTCGWLSEGPVQAVIMH